MIILIFIATFLSSQYSASTGSVYSRTTWQDYVPVYEYSSYSNGQLQEFIIPDHCIKSVWVISAGFAPASCEERTIQIYMQHGSFPLVTPHNETYPDGFYLARTSVVQLSVVSNYTTLVYTLHTPLPGSVYSIAFLGDFVDDRISQKGLSSSCGHYLGITQVVEAYDTVPSVPMNTPHSLTNVSYTNNLYRFHTTANTWKYTVYITGCSFNPDSNTIPSRIACPLSISVRAQAIPDITVGTQAQSVNCDRGSCEFVVNSPHTETWHYILFSPSEDGVFMLELMIESKECLSSEGQWHQHMILASLSEFNSSSKNFTTASHNRTDIPMPLLSLLNHPQHDISPIDLHPNNLPPLTPNFDSFPGNPPLLPGTHQLPPTTHHLLHQAINTSQWSMEFGGEMCLSYGSLGRYATSNNPFYTTYNIGLGVAFLPNEIAVSDKGISVLSFTVLPVLDSGGTLKIELKLEINDSVSAVVTVGVCVRRGVIPIEGEEGVGVCEEGSRLNLTSNIQPTAHMYVPYPEPGTWYIAMTTQCYATMDSVEPVSCDDLRPVVSFSVAVSPCVDGGCGEYGSCRLRRVGRLALSTCSCFGNHRGYGCTDASVADSDGQMLLATLLLTLSNLAFIPAILVSLYRAFYTQALLYLYTMVFSTLYHACDGENKYLYCIMPYHVLSHCDFFGSIMSFWVTLMAMARIPNRARSFSYVLAALALAVGVTWDKHSLWTFLVPCLCAVVVMLVSWMVQCHIRASCYPRPLRWLLWLLPGILLAATGLIVFAFFQTTSNYQYTHSAWHACMALCVVFILPPAPSTSMKSEGSLTVSDTSDAPGFFMSHNYFVDNPGLSNSELDEATTESDQSRSSTDNPVRLTVMHRLPQDKYQSKHNRQGTITPLPV